MGTLLWVSTHPAPERGAGSSGSPEEGDAHEDPRCPGQAGGKAFAPAGFQSPEKMLSDPPAKGTGLPGVSFTLRGCFQTSAAGGMGARFVER